MQKGKRVFFMFLVLVVALPLFIGQVNATATVPSTTYFGFNDVYLNFASTQTFASHPYRVNNTWYFNSYAVNLEGANATITSYYANNLLIVALSSSAGNNSAFTIDTGTHGAPVSVEGASSWSYDSVTGVLTVLRFHVLAGAYTVRVTFVAQTLDLLGNGDIDLLTQYLLAGDLLGFLVACYTTRIGQVFYAILALIITVPLAIRTNSISYCAIIWIVLGGLFQAAMPVISPVAVFLIILGVASLLYKLFAGKTE